MCTKTLLDTISDKLTVHYTELSSAKGSVWRKEEAVAVRSETSPWIPGPGNSRNGKSRDHLLEEVTFLLFVIWNSIRSACGLESPSSQERLKQYTKTWNSRKKEGRWTLEERRLTLSYFWNNPSSVRSFPFARTIKVCPRPRGSDNPRNLFRRQLSSAEIPYLRQAASDYFTSHCSQVSGENQFLSSFSPKSHPISIFFFCL